MQHRLFTDISILEQPIGHIFKGQAVFLGCVTFEDATNRLTQHVSNQLPTYATQHPKTANTPATLR
jgi:hypothetical protein